MTTPIETYDGILVKREDLCFDAPAPPFSKLRGLMVHLEHLKKQGILTVGYVETSISMAGWGVAWACKGLNMQAVIFDPIYKNETNEVLLYHREQWKRFNATIIPIKASMAKVNWYICKKLLQEQFPNSILLPLGLPFEETIKETAKELLKTLYDIKPASIVSCVGSGTICAGLLKGWASTGQSGNLYGVMSRTGDIKYKKQIIEYKAKISCSGIFTSSISLNLINPGWEYTQPSKILVPFPCHAYYDAKAWQWLIENKSEIKEPILFWNIGH